MNFRAESSSKPRNEFQGWKLKYAEARCTSISIREHTLLFNGIITGMQDQNEMTITSLLSDIYPRKFLQEEIIDFI